MNPLSQSHLKKLLKLKQKKYRDLEQKVLVEGNRLLRQIDHYGIEFDELIISSDAWTEYDDLKAGTRFEAQSWQLEKLSDTQRPQSCIAVISYPELSIIADRFLLYLDRIKDPGNLGTIFRTGAAAGISGIILSPDCCEVYNPKVIRSSLGAVFRLPHEIKDYRWVLEQASTKIISTVDNGKNLFSFNPPANNIILIIGSEAFGVEKVLSENADHKLYIPMSPEMESLNAAVACGIFIYQLQQNAVTE